MVLGYPTSTNLQQVDGLSTDPQDLVRHKVPFNVGRNSHCEAAKNTKFSIKGKMVISIEILEFF